MKPHDLRLVRGKPVTMPIRIQPEPFGGTFYDLELKPWIVFEIETAAP
jgi:hypothetical protein